MASRRIQYGIAPAVIRQMVDAFQDGVALADDHGTITLANRRLDTMFGYRHDELLGHPIEFLIHRTCTTGTAGCGPATTAPPGPG